MSQDCAGLSAADPGNAEGLGLMTAGAGAGEMGQSHGPAVSHVLLPSCAPSSAVGSVLGGYPGQGCLRS